jgi:hypothetical protein
MGPEEVDLVPVHALFAERHRQLRRFDEPAEVDLQVGVGELEEELVEEKAQRVGSRAISVADGMSASSTREGRGER